MTDQPLFGEPSNAGEDVHELIQQDQEAQAKKRLQTLIEDGLNSGYGRVLTTLVVRQLKARARGDRR
jgi:antitoxin ParD1/3/4